MKRRSALTVFLLGAAAPAALTACTSGPQKELESIETFPGSWDDEITIDVFAVLANYMGMQEGWFAKMVKDRFNMKLNVIAPNVAGGGDTLFNTRVSSGDLGDLIVTAKGTQMRQLVDGGLVHDVSPYYPAMKNLKKFDAAVQHLSEEYDGMHALPTQVSSIKPWEPSEGVDPTFGAFIRWDYYREQGYPQIATLEDLLPILGQMQAAHPRTEDGKPVYALSLFKDWDGNMMVLAKQPACLYGYDEMGFVLAKADGSDYQSILDSDSHYVRALRFYYRANKLGLVDPESTTQNFDTVNSKYEKGQVLLSWWPWVAQAAFNTDKNLAEGKGFMLAPIVDQMIFSYGAEAYGATQVFAVGSRSEDPERVAAFLDWLYSPEGAYSGANQTAGASGPQGLTWDVDGSGAPQPSDVGRKVYLDGDADVPADWGGGQYVAGASALNTTSVLPADVDTATGLPYSYKSWPSYQALVKNPVQEDWTARTGATTTMQYLEDQKQLLVGAGAGYASAGDDSLLETTRNQVKAIIVQMSWQMAFASDDAQFEALLTKMQQTAQGLGYDTVLEADMKDAKAQNDARQAVIAAFS